MRRLAFAHGTAASAGVSLLDCGRCRGGPLDLALLLDPWFQDPRHSSVAAWHVSCWVVPAALIGLLAFGRRRSARLIAAYVLPDVLKIATWSIVARNNGSVITNIGAFLGFFGFGLSSVAAR